MTFIDMFCGMGTIRMGFEQAGHECVYSIEFDKHKRKIYEVIFGNEPEGNDIRSIHADDLPAADCWCFGAPCQDFSIAGLRAGLDGDRSSLVREVFRLIEEKDPSDRPEWLLYENVKGMLSSNSGWDFASIQAEMGELGYDVEWQLLNSKDFRVPQNRERVYTLGHLRARGRRKVFPIRENGRIPDAKGRADGRQPQVQPCATTLRSSGNTKADGTYVIVSKDGNIKENNTVDQYASCLTAGAHSGGNHSDMDLIAEPCACLTPDRVEKRQNGRRFKEPGEPMFTLTKQDIHGVTQNSRIRRLTPRECMRLQGVPDCITDKLIAAKISDTQMYRAAGDACTVNVIYAIAERMKRLGLYSKKSLTYKEDEAR